jgi:hypothetical protein
MDRRNFLRSLVGGIAVGAAQRTFPFRVFSFPKEVVQPRGKWRMVMNPYAVYGNEWMLHLYISGTRRHDGIWDVRNTFFPPDVDKWGTIALPPSPPQSS